MQTTQTTFFLSPKLKLSFPKPPKLQLNQRNKLYHQLPLERGPPNPHTSTHYGPYPKIRPNRLHHPTLPLPLQPRKRPPRKSLLPLLRERHLALHPLLDPYNLCRRTPSRGAVRGDDAVAELEVGLGSAVGVWGFGGVGGCVGGECGWACVSLSPLCFRLGIGVCILTRMGVGLERFMKRGIL